MDPANATAAATAACGWQLLDSAMRDLPQMLAVAAQYAPYAPSPTTTPASSQRAGPASLPFRPLLVASRPPPTATAPTAAEIRAVPAPLPPPRPAMRHTGHADTRDPASSQRAGPASLPLRPLHVATRQPPPATAQTAAEIRAVLAPLPPPRPAMRHTEHADTRAVMARGQYTDGGQPASTSQLRRRPLVLPVAPEAATATAQTAAAIRAVSAPMPPPQPAMRHTKHAGTLIDTAIGDDVNLNCNGHLETAAPAPALAAGEYEAAAGEHPATSPLRPPAAAPPP